ncbi:hypothetical protein [Streptomyces sp. NPDC056821]|uniref:hypothetical protein n=1 Tax=unclassified Streptomyces TaxID=2593676 RepID=UPI0036B98770
MSRHGQQGGQERHSIAEEHRQATEERADCKGTGGETRQLRALEPPMSEQPAPPTPPGSSWSPQPPTRSARTQPRPAL